MGIDRAMAISLSAVEAERTQTEIIASNLANIATTRSIDGGPYRRRMVILGEKQLSFAEELAMAEQGQIGKGVPGGVRVLGIVEDLSPFPRVYKPGNPDADSAGFVSLPNVSLAKEMTDLIYTSKVYEANIVAYNASKKMAQDTLQIQ